MALTMLAGPNFSGRSAALRHWVGLGADAPPGCAYVGPDPVASLSGLAPTVAGEIDLMASDRAASKRSREWIEAAGFAHILCCNPFTLSGGEQVVAAVAAAAAIRPRRLAIDCAFEQLAADTRSQILSWLETLEGEVRIADNRLAQWHHGPIESLEGPSVPASIDTDAVVPPRSGQQIEVIDLSFAYRRGRPIFSGLNLTLDADRSYWLRGPNGSGKSTFSKLLCGLLKPTGGEIRVDGKRVEPWRHPGRWVSYHFQDPNLQLFARSIERQLLHATDPTTAARTFGVPVPIATHPLDLPFVLRKRLAIACAFLAPAPALVLDEPTLAQDDLTAHALRQMSDRRGGIVISHSTFYQTLPSIDF